MTIVRIYYISHVHRMSENDLEFDSIINVIDMVIIKQNKSEKNYKHFSFVQKTIIINHYFKWR